MNVSATSANASNSQDTYNSSTPTQETTTIKSLPSVCVSKIIGEAIVKDIDQLLFGPPTDASHRRRTITDAIASVKLHIDQIIK